MLLAEGLSYRSLGKLPRAARIVGVARLKAVFNTDAVFKDDYDLRPNPHVGSSYLVRCPRLR